LRPSSLVLGLMPHANDQGQGATDAGLFADAQQFLDRRLPLDDLAQAVLLQVFHAGLDCLLLEGVDVRVVAEQLADTVLHHQQLEDAGAPVVAAAAAVFADNRLGIGLAFGLAFVGFGRAVEILDFVRRQVGLAKHVRIGLVAHLALGAEQAYQALAQDRADGASRSGRVHAEVDRTDRSGRGVVGVWEGDATGAGLGGVAWGVGGVWQGMCGVWGSRISPIMMTSGSWRNMLRSSEAKVLPALRLTSICVTLWTWHSTGFSIVITFFWKRSIWLRPE